MNGFCRNILTAGVLILFSLFFVSCNSTQRLTIDIPVSTPGVLPGRIQGLTLVTRAVDKSFTNLDSDSLQRIFYRNRFNHDTLINDIQMADTTLKVLGELLFESGRYDYVIPEHRFLSSEGRPPSLYEMPWEQVRYLCETYNTDAVLSLDHLRSRVAVSYKNEVYYDLSRNGFTRGVFVRMKIYYEALFRVYDPSIEEVILQERFRDTLYWEDNSAQNLFDRFTPVKQALSEAGIVAALELADKIAIKWRPESRNYFVRGSADFRRADRMVAAGNWSSAIEIWKQIARESRSDARKSKAQFNLALAYEIEGDIDQAIRWALASYESMYRPLTYDYLITLRKRKTEIEQKR